VLYHVREHPEYAPEDSALAKKALQRGERKFEQLLPLCGAQTLALVREFQNAVDATCVERTMTAAKSWRCESVLVSVAWPRIARCVHVEGRAKAAGVDVFFPSRRFRTDNAG